MYNVGFGDCFCLRDRKNNLLVDFGTSNNRIEGRPRRDIFDMVISDLTTISRKNLLLTHFHLDHLSGLLYMLKKRRDSFEFGKIYLPDVFSIPEMNGILGLLLLADLVKDSCLPSHQVSFFALVEALSRHPQKVELLSRGTVFEDRYRALWPDQRVILKETEEISSVPELEREFRSLRSTSEFQQLLEELELRELELRHFKSKIGIVFQNKEDGDWNLLFTGDVQPEHMKMIAENYDGKYPLYEQYWCIKVPHHGTESHYFDFRPYMPENLLISNGIYHATSKKRARMYRTSTQYTGLFHIGEADTCMCCSNSDCCDGCRDGCSCREQHIIAPNYYFDI